MLHEHVTQQKNITKFVAEHSVLHKERNILSNKYFKRKNPRLKYYDYTLSGYYFITICTKEKKHYFGEIANGIMQYKDVGKIANECIEKINDIYKSIKLDKYIIMPNHIHMILIVEKETTTPISRAIKQYKEYITKRIKEHIWQKSYYDHIIRNEKDYLRIWKYIDENILKWELDKYYN